MTESAHAFQFDGQTHEIKKLSTYSLSLAFRNEVLPIIHGNLRPIELFLAAALNEVAPMNGEWGLVDSMISSDKEMDQHFLPAFKFMLKNYTGKVPSDDALDRICEISAVHDAVMAQIDAEGIMPFYLKRRMTGIAQAFRAIGFTDEGIDLSKIASQTEQIIKDRLTRLANAGEAGKTNSSSK
jgi:hypothetical protein